MYASDHGFYTYVDEMNTLIYGDQILEEAIGNAKFFGVDFEWTPTFPLGSNT